MLIAKAAPALKSKRPVTGSFAIRNVHRTVGAMLGGEIARRYAKLRRSERHARAGGNWRAVHKHLHALHRVEVSIRRCVQRVSEGRCNAG